VVVVAFDSFAGGWCWIVLAPTVERIPTKTMNALAAMPVMPTMRVVRLTTQKLLSQALQR
jgi:hypothetical protein